jgi:hypothetical protein
MAHARGLDVDVLGVVVRGLCGDHAVQPVDVALQVVGVGRQYGLDRPAAARPDVQAVAGHQDTRLRRSLVDSVQYGREPGSDRVDPLGDLIHAALGVPLLARGRGRVEVDAVLGDADEPGIVPADRQGHQGGVRAERVELRRRGAGGHAGHRSGERPGG